MKKTKAKPFYLIHSPTGARVPINPRYIDQVRDGGDIVFSKIESRVNRKYFSLPMVSKRWDFDFEKIMKLLSTYQIPVFSLFAPIRDDGTFDPEHILIFEEYILALEKKLQLPHVKIKPKKLEIEHA